MRVYEPPSLAAAAVALAVLLLAMLTGVGAVRRLAPPPALPADAAPELFSAGRAMADVTELSRRPHPLGSRAHAVARSYVVDRLSELGLEVEIQSETVIEPLPRYILAARVHNVVARLAGTAGSAGSADGRQGAILLAAHYDTRPTTPGAGDDSSGVSVILEIVRALKIAPPLARDVVVLISDGEELGLLGARAFVERHRWAGEIEYVVNFEARGSGGPAMMFETGRGNADLAELFAAVAPHPQATSLTFDVYQRMPNDTDFTIFREAGWTGYNFAFIHGYPSYHTALDTAARLSADSLQQEGANALALLRHLDGASVDLDSGGAVYFSPFGRGLVVYSPSFAVGIGVTLAVLVLLVALRARSLGWLSAGGLLHTLLLTALFLVGSAVAAVMCWLFFRQLFPGLEAAPHSFHYASLPAGLALLAIAAALGVFLAARQLGPRNHFEMTFGIAVAWVLLALFSLSELPGGSYLFAWPALALLVGLLAVSFVERTDPSSPLAVGLLGVAALPAPLLWAPTAEMVLQALTLQLAVIVLLVAAIACLPLLPQLAVLGRRFAITGVLLLAIGLGGLAWIGAASHFDAERPATDSLLYVWEADSEEAAWWTLDAATDEWTERFVDPTAELAPFPGFLPLSREARGLRGGAERIAVDAPTIEVTRDDRQDGGRQIEAHLVSRRGAPILHVSAEAAVPITALTIDDQTVSLADDGLASLHLVYLGVPAEGARVALSVSGRWPIEATLADQSYGLPTGLLAGRGGDRPRHLIPMTSWWTDSTFVWVDALF